VQDKACKYLLKQIRLTDFWRLFILILIIGWSHLSLNLGAKIYDHVSTSAVQQDHEIVLVYKNPKYTKKAKEGFTQALFSNADMYYKDILTKKQFMAKMNSAKGIKVISTYKADYSSVYLVMGIIFLLWISPILIILLIGIYLKGTKHTPNYDDPY